MRRILLINQHVHDSAPKPNMKPNLILGFISAFAVLSFGPDLHGEEPHSEELKAKRQAFISGVLDRADADGNRKLNEVELTHAIEVMQAEAKARREQLKAKADEEGREFTKIREGKTVRPQDAAKKMIRFRGRKGEIDREKVEGILLRQLEKQNP